MQKRLKQGVLILGITILMLFLVSCKGQVAGGEKPTDTAAALKIVQSGTQGVQVELLPNYPPSMIYDLNEFLALAEVKNLGNHDLQPEECFVQVTGFDKNILGSGLLQPRRCAEGLSILEGKNVYNTKGGVNQIEFKSTSVRLPPGVFEYSPLLNFVTCYRYVTIANPSVCVDPLFYQVTADQKTCRPTNVMMGGGQGAPVGVTYVGVNMVGGNAVFEINVANLGSGKVLSRNSDIQNCGQASIDRTELDKIDYAVRLSGGSKVDCRPRDTIRLTNNNAKIICTFTIDGPSAFETPLMIDLEYNYIDSFTKQIQIVRTPQ